jgi:hypothetical protein
MTETLSPWCAILTSHESVLEGRLAEPVFTANLRAVGQGTAPDLYLDPAERR